MDLNEARELLDTERLGILKLIGNLDVASLEDREGANEQGDHDDSAESLVGEGYDSAIEATLRRRLNQVEAAHCCCPLRGRPSRRVNGRRSRSRPAEPLEPHFSLLPTAK